MVLLVRSHRSTFRVHVSKSVIAHCDPGGSHEYLSRSRRAALVASCVERVAF